MGGVNVNKPAFGPRQVFAQGAQQMIPSAMDLLTYRDNCNVVGAMPRKDAEMLAGGNPLHFRRGIGDAGQSPCSAGGDSFQGSFPQPLFQGFIVFLVAGEFHGIGLIHC